MNFFDDLEKVGFSNIDSDTPNVDVENENTTETIEPSILEIVKNLVASNANLENKLTEIFDKLKPITEKEKENENRTDL